MPCKWDADLIKTAIATGVRRVIMEELGKQHIGRDELQIIDGYNDVRTIADSAGDQVVNLWEKLEQRWQQENQRRKQQTGP